MMKKESALTAIIILGVAALAYLPLVARFGYAYDDWYLMYAAKAYGSQAFHAIFSIDRPLRAYVMIPAYELFGENPLWYNLSAYVFRVVGAWALWWMLAMMWPGAKAAATGMAILFVVYPGFVAQPNAIDYQSHIIALALALFSLALTVRAFQTSGLAIRSALMAVSVLCGWAYLGLMEYYIGFELIRFLVVAFLVVQTRAGRLAQLNGLIRGWLPLTLVPTLFLYWRIFLFTGERKATDAGLQLSLFLASPLQTTLAWMAGLLQDVLDVLVTAWIDPLMQLLPGLRLSQVLTGLGIGLLTALLACWGIKHPSRENAGDWRVGALRLGLAAVVAGLIPIVLANRGVSFPHYSRYTLISSIGAVMVWVALIDWLPLQRLRRIAFFALVLAAALTHYGNSVRAAQETASMNAFWWQVAWRIPQIEQNTTLVAHYPAVSILEDYFIWGPANLIYYPRPLVADGMKPGIFAAIPNDETLQKVLARERQLYFNRRGIATFPNYRNILILTQPSMDSCVQVIDGTRPELSPFETSRFVEMAPFSEPEHILLDESFHIPPEAVFGPEPAHSWCYFYQKATLARQRGEWRQVAELGGEAASGGFAPGDPIEWMPFLQAYAVLGDVGRLTAISAQMQDPDVRGQACQILADMGGLSPEVRAQARELFCSGR